MCARSGTLENFEEIMQINWEGWMDPLGMLKDRLKEWDNNGISRFIGTVIRF